MKKTTLKLLLIYIFLITNYAIVYGMNNTDSLTTSRKNERNDNDKQDQEHNNKLQKTTHESQEKKQDIKECSICYYNLDFESEIDAVKTLPCGHFFHIACLAQTDNNRKNSQYHDAEEIRITITSNRHKEIVTTQQRTMTQASNAEELGNITCPLCRAIIENTILDNIKLKASLINNTVAKKAMNLSIDLIQKILLAFENFSINDFQNELNTIITLTPKIEIVSLLSQIDTLTTNGSDVILQQIPNDSDYFSQEKIEFRRIIKENLKQAITNIKEVHSPY